jgi:hypothetical protein
MKKKGLNKICLGENEKNEKDTSPFRSKGYRARYFPKGH